MILLLIFSYSTDLSLVFSSTTFIHSLLSSKSYHFQTCQEYEGMDLYTSAWLFIAFSFSFFLSTIEKEFQKSSEVEASVSATSHCYAIKMQQNF